jgi:hypothetical protein
MMTGQNDQSAESASIPPDGTATVQPPSLALAEDILELASREVAAGGVAGEVRLVKLLYLATTSRLLERPCSVVVKGPSAGGKSFVVQQVLELFPADAYYALSAMSERALAYDNTPLVHRMLVLYEAAGLRGDIASYLMRSLLSEGRISYVTVTKTKAGLGPQRIDRDGPTGLITTTTAVHLHPENETRLLSLTVNDTPDQTRAVMVAHAREPRPDRGRAPWRQLQEWLAGTAPDVIVPFASALAEAIPPVTTRLRRDFPTLITLIEAHALLHQMRRARDGDGRVIASFGDYAAVRDLIADLIADAAERTVSTSVRATVDAIRDLETHDPLGEGLTVGAVARKLGIDKSSASRRIRVATERGYLRNLEDHRGRPARLVLGDAMPGDVGVLPTASELERLHGCTPDQGDIEVPLEADYPPSAWAVEPSLGLWGPVQ